MRVSPRKPSFTSRYVLPAVRRMVAPDVLRFVAVATLTAVAVFGLGYTASYAGASAACAAAVLGPRVRLLARYTDPTRPPFPGAVAMTCTECGAHIVWVNPPLPSSGRTVCSGCDPTGDGSTVRSSSKVRQ